MEALRFADIDRFWIAISKCVALRDIAEVEGAKHRLKSRDRHGYVPGCKASSTLKSEKIDHGRSLGPRDDVNVTMAYIGVHFWRLLLPQLVGSRGPVSGY